MIISEFLPNPIGKDTGGEWIKLFNEGNAVIELNGWQIKDAAGKTFIFPADGGKNKLINPGEYLILDYKTTKISLNNNGEALFLYNPKGELIDKAEYIGVAPEGKSLIRQNNDQFVFSSQNAPKQVISTEIQNQDFNAATAISDTNQNNFINKKEFNFNGLLIGILLSLILAFVFVVIYKKLNNNS
ncbi:MAG: lamin tail domain-containing protein [Patescibacteria group bacterium]